MKTMWSYNAKILELGEVSVTMAVTASDPLNASPFCLTNRTQCKSSWQCVQLKEITVSLHMNLLIVNLTKMQTCVPSVSGRSEIAACPLSPVASNPTVLPSPTFSPSSSQ